MDVKQILYNWCQKAKLGTPNYECCEISGHRQHVKCEVRIEGFDYVGVGHSTIISSTISYHTIKKDAYTNAALDFIQYLVREGKMSADDVPASVLVKQEENMSAAAESTGVLSGGTFAPHLQVGAEDQSQEPREYPAYQSGPPQACMDRSAENIKVEESGTGSILTETGTQSESIGASLTSDNNKVMTEEQSVVIKTEILDDPEMLVGDGDDHSLATEELENSPEISKKQNIPKSNPPWWTPECEAAVVHLNQKLEAEHTIENEGERQQCMTDLKCSFWAAKTDFLLKLEQDFEECVTHNISRSNQPWWTPKCEATAAHMDKVSKTFASEQTPENKAAMEKGLADIKCVFLAAKDVFLFKLEEDFLDCMQQYIPKRNMAWWTPECEIATARLHSANKNFNAEPTQENAKAKKLAGDAKRRIFKAARHAFFSKKELPVNPDKIHILYEPYRPWWTPECDTAESHLRTACKTFLDKPTEENEAAKKKALADKESIFLAAKDIFLSKLEQECEECDSSGTTSEKIWTPSKAYIEHTRRELNILKITLMKYRFPKRPKYCLVLKRLMSAGALRCKYNTKQSDNITSATLHINHILLAEGTSIHPGIQSGLKTQLYSKAIHVLKTESVENIMSGKIHTDITTESTTESTTERTTESTTERTTESTTERTTESTTESTAESTTEITTRGTKEKIVPLTHISPEQFKWKLQKTKNFILSKGTNENSEVIFQCLRENKIKFDYTIEKINPENGEYRCRRKMAIEKRVFASVLGTGKKVANRELSKLFSELFMQKTVDELYQMLLTRTYVERDSTRGDGCYRDTIMVTNDGKGEHSGFDNDPNSQKQEPDDPHVAGINDDDNDNDDNDNEDDSATDNRYYAKSNSLSSLLNSINSSTEEKSTSATKRKHTTQEKATKRKHTTQEHEQHLQNLKKICSSNSETPTMDEFDTFGQTVANSLRSVSVYKFNVARKHIMDYLNDIQTNDSPRNLPSPLVNKSQSRGSSRSTTYLPRKGREIRKKEMERRTMEGNDKHMIDYDKQSNSSYTQRDAMNRNDGYGVQSNTSNTQRDTMNRKDGYGVQSNTSYTQRDTMNRNDRHVIDYGHGMQSNSSYTQRDTMVHNDAIDQPSSSHFARDAQTINDDMDIDDDDDNADESATDNRYYAKSNSLSSLLNSMGSFLQQANNSNK